MLNGLKLAMVGEFIPWKWTNAVSQGFILPGEPIVNQHTIGGRTSLFSVYAHSNTVWQYRPGAGEGANPTMHQDQLVALSILCGPL